MAELGPEARTVVDVQRAAGIAVIHLAGEIDLSNVEQVRHALNSLSSEVTETVIFELADVQFLDSSGLSTLVMAANRFGGTVQIRNAGPFVRRVIEISGLSPVLRVES